MTHRAGALIAILTLLVAGCGQVEPTATPTADPPTATLIAVAPTESPVLPTDTPSPTATETPLPTQTPTATHTPQPSPTATPSAYEEVTLETADRVTLAGWLYRPPPATEKPVAVVLAHEYYASHWSWNTFALRLAQDGFTALAFDFRGHGKSKGVIKPATIALDTKAAIAYLEGQGFDQVVCMGASMGGSGCLAAAIDAELAGLVLISSPMNVPETVEGRTLVREKHLAALTMPKLFMITEQDIVIETLPDFVDQFLRMYELVPDPKELIVYPGNDHGTALLFEVEFGYGEDVQTKLLEFLQAQAPGDAR